MGGGGGIVEVLNLSKLLSYRLFWVIVIKINLGKNFDEEQDISMFSKCLSTECLQLARGKIIPWRNQTAS